MKEKMHNCELYFPGDEAIMKEQTACLEKLYDFNATRPLEGDNVVVGAGSVVTKDLPDNVIAVVNPCKVLREVNEHDREFYFKDRRIAPELLEQ